MGEKSFVQDSSGCDSRREEFDDEEARRGFLDGIEVESFCKACEWMSVFSCEIEEDLFIRVESFFIVKIDGKKKRGDVPSKSMCSSKEDAVLR